MIWDTRGGAEGLIENIPHDSGRGGTICQNLLDSCIPPQLKCTGMPRLLALLEKHEIPATFYYTGTIAETHPGLVKMAKDKGHEIGCHGMTKNVG